MYIEITGAMLRRYKKGWLKMVTMVKGKYWFKMHSLDFFGCGERCAHFIQITVENKEIFLPMKINRNKKMIARTATYLGV